MLENQDKPIIINSYKDISTTTETNIYMSANTGIYMSSPILSITGDVTLNSGNIYDSASNPYIT
jgi:hypothetical protein